MTDVEAYDRACALWGDGVAWRIGDRCIVGHWVPIGEWFETLDSRGTVVLLRTMQRGCMAMGEGDSWEAAFVAAERKARLIAEGGARDGGAIEP